MVFQVALLLALLFFAAPAEAVCTWPNEPAGATLVHPLADTQFTWTPVFNVTTNNWNYASQSFSGSLTLVTNPGGLTAPCDGSGKAWDFFYPVGFPVGIAPSWLIFNFANFPTGYTSGTLYLAFWFMYSSNFANEPLNKMVSMYHEDAAGLDPGIFFEGRGDNDNLSTVAPTVGWMVIQSSILSGGATGAPVDHSTTFPLGQWHQAEMTINLATGVANQWIDGVRKLTNFSFGSFIPTGHGINEARIFPSWGGNVIGQTVPTDQHWYLAHIRMSISSGGPPPPQPPAAPSNLIVHGMLLLGLGIAVWKAVSYSAA